MAYIRRSPIWPDPRVKPPFGAATIDWEHPLTRGLAACWLFNELGGSRIVDHVSGRATGTTVNNPNVTSGAKGIQRHLTAASSQYASCGSSLPANTADGSIVVRSLLIDPTTAYHMAIGRAAGTGQDWEYQVNPSAIIQLAYNGGSQVACVKTAVANTWVDVAFVISAAATGQAFYNGKLDNTNGGPTAWRTGNGVIEIGRRASSSFYWNGDLGHIYLYTTRLFPADVLYVTQEPYAMFRPIIRRRYSIPASASVSRLPSLALLGVGS